MNKNLHKIKTALEPGIFQLTLALTLTIIGLAWNTLGLPTPEELTQIAGQLFEQLGTIILLLGAFIEGIFMINLYFPGSLVILLAILVSDRSLASLTVIALTTWIGFSISTALNYYIGRWGFYRVLLVLGSTKVIPRMKAWLDKRGSLAVLLAAVHPNFLAISLVCMGIANEGFFKSTGIALLGLLIWVPILTALMAIILPNTNDSSIFYWFLVLILYIWGVILIAQEKSHPQQTHS